MVVHVDRVVVVSVDAGAMDGIIGRFTMGFN